LCRRCWRAGSATTRATGGSYPCYASYARYPRYPRYHLSYPRYPSYTTPATTSATPATIPATTAATPATTPATTLLLKLSALSREAGLRAVLDMWMLAAADDLVITPSSTYGMMGAALNSAEGSREFRRAGPVYPTRWGKCARAVSRQPVCHSWLRIRRASCFDPAMLVPEFDMLCPDCTLWSCPCDGANPCSSHTDPDNALDEPRYTKHLPL